MIPYVIWRLLHAETEERPKGIIIQPYIGDRRLFRIDTIHGTVTRTSGSSYQRGDWILVDGKASREADTLADSPLRLKNNLKFIIFISPGGENLEDLKGRKEVSKKIMSPFTLEELLSMRRLVHSEVRDPDVIRQRYYSIGGVPRYIFDTPEDIPERLNTAVRGRSPNDILSCIGETVQGKNVYRYVTYPYSCIQPWRNPDDNDYRYGFAIGQFASDAIKRLLMNEWLKRRWDELFHIIFYESNAYIRGVHFEEAMHGLIPRDRSAVPPMAFPNDRTISYEKGKGWPEEDVATRLELLSSVKEDMIDERDMERLVNFALKRRRFGAVYARPLSTILKPLTLYTFNVIRLRMMVKNYVPVEILPVHCC